MAWIESHQELGAHPKTRRLARLLGCPATQAIGILQCLWWWAVDYAPDGDLGRYESGDIADACLWEGDADTLALALGAAGFLDDGRYIHDWEEYTGRLITQRAANAERKRMSRARHADVPRTSAAVTGLHNTTEQYRTVQDIPPSVGAAQSAAPARPPAKRLAKPAFVPLSAEERSKLETEFEDIPEVAGVIDLALAHESARKYPVGQYLYVRNWLRRDRDRFTAQQPRRPGARASPGSPGVPDEYDIDAYLAREEASTCRR